jgi:hypothetical protein
MTRHLAGTELAEAGVAIDGCSHDWAGGPTHRRICHRPAERRVEQFTNTKSLASSAEPARRSSR